MKRRRLILATPLLTLALAAGCGDGDDSADEGDRSASTSTTAGSATTHAGAIGGQVLPPEILTPETTSATVSVGTVVSFDMGEPGEGRFVATSSDPSVFRVDSEGKDQGGFTTNAGGTAVAPGTAEVAVAFHGATNGIGTPTTFTITVE